MDAYKHNNYRYLIDEWVSESAPSGSRTRLAKAAQCSPSWVTRVLNGSVHLTPDQALGIASAMNLNDTETDYFLTLVDLDRASTLQLKKRLQKKIDELKREGRKLASSIKTDSLVSEEKSVRYYSTWLYPAIHVACMVKALRADEIAKQFHLAESAINESLHELNKLGLLVKEGMHWKATSTNVHLRADHPAAKVAHVAWRNRTIQHLFEGHQDGLHYSAVHCLSRSDLEKLHAQLKKAILDCRNTIEKSPSEALAVFCVDWYQL